MQNNLIRETNSVNHLENPITKIRTPGEFIPEMRDEDEHRRWRLVKTLKNLIDLAGFELIGRIQLRDKKTGRISR